MVAILSWFKLLSGSVFAELTAAPKCPLIAAIMIYNEHQGGTEVDTIIRATRI